MSVAAAELDLLTSPDAEDLLAAAVGTAGGTLGRWRVSQVDHRTEVTTVSYRADVTWADGTRRETLGASARPAGAAPDPPAPGLVTLTDGVVQVSVWAVPHDPDLPALAAALDPGALGRLLDSYGLDGAGVRTQVVAYRPRRRAVVRVTSRGAGLYLKVLPPGDDVAALHARHRLLGAAGVPVPPSLGWTGDGLLVLEALPGNGLRGLLHADAEGRRPGADELLAVLERFPAAVADLPRRTPWADLAPRYAHDIGAVLPEQADRVRELAAAVTAGLAGAGEGTDPTHGDFYEAQFLVAGDALTGLLDVDTAGPGRRADDLACALAHLESLALADPAYAGRALGLAAEWEAGFARTVDAEELRLRTAGTLIALATGPHRVQTPTWRADTAAALDLVERRL